LKKKGWQRWGRENDVGPVEKRSLPAVPTPRSMRRELLFNGHSNGSGAGAVRKIVHCWWKVVPAREKEKRSEKKSTTTTIGKRIGDDAKKRKDTMYTRPQKKRPQGRAP